MLLIPTIHVELADPIDTEFFFLELYLVGVRCKFGGERADVIGECCGKKDDLYTTSGKLTL